MKRVRVKFIHARNEECWGTLIESMEDIKILQEHLEIAQAKVVHKLVNSNEPAYRYDHVLSDMSGLENPLCQLATMQGGFQRETQSTLFNENPIFNLPNVSALYLNTVITSFTKNKKPVLIQERGGVTPMYFGDEKWLEILEEEEFVKFNNILRFYISKNTKILNLENSYEIDRSARESMTKIDPNYSYILEFGLLSSYQLKNIFEKFVKNGGDTIYVYTTGTNVEQMYRYAKDAVSNGIYKFIFEFNMGMNDDIRKFISWLDSYDKTKVKVL